MAVSAPPMAITSITMCSAPSEAKPRQAPAAPHRLPPARLPHPGVRRRALFGIILVIIAALAMLAVALGRDISEGGRMVRQKQMENSLAGQLAKIERAILACQTAYPYPSTPFPRPWPEVPADGLASSLTCPGNGEALWQEAQGDFLAPPPRGFGDWRYVAADPALYLVIAPPAGSDADVEAVLDRLVAANAPRAEIVDGDFRFYLRR